ncbi:hypothetical protein [Mesorhizobium sp. M7A.F.Ca.CA.002.12.1.1]|uniref:hypothetical protein n=1 Tax=Mesorhizobium sp. M7A.F.Ca.CA.002.12.1.1 TaxID=2496735 RepID=UPI000FCCCC4D|nr:hypothetical protein [Mesorhizobium sp. M7A.F.Ca.CA.002.12.1.1]RUX60165.1 hypothetical protein EN989_11150 [Mesorhizobium sp. M7A.F.Ca.CA.002.12.1.1]
MTELKSSDNLFAGIKAGATPVAPVTAAPVTVPSAPAPAPEAEVEEPAAPQISHLDMLKSRARLMGVTFSNNISVEALKKKIDAKLSDDSQADDEVQEEANLSALDANLGTVTSGVTAGVTAEQIAAAQAVLAAAGLAPAAAPAKVSAGAPVKSLRQLQMQEQMKLVRLRITNLDPKKKDLPGEILTVANRFIGTVRKYIPYGEVTDNGWHVPYCLYTMMKDREFLNIKVTKNNKSQEVVETRWVREFSLEVLEPLTQVELARLAAAQAAGNNID